jgi:hypothetical protein
LWRAKAPLRRGGGWIASRFALAMTPRSGRFRQLEYSSDSIMHLVQLLLPIYDNEGHALPHELYGAIRDELVARFSGLTAFTRAPAEGLWTREGYSTSRDDIVVFEVMVTKIDEKWWSEYRKTLETRLRQESVVIRTHSIRLL